MAFAMIHELARSWKNSVAMGAFNKKHPADFSRIHHQQKHMCVFVGCIFLVFVVPTIHPHFGIPRISQVCFFEQRFLTGDLEFDFRESLAKRALAPTNEKPLNFDVLKFDAKCKASLDTLPETNIDHEN